MITRDSVGSNSIYTASRWLYKIFSFEGQITRSDYLTAGLVLVPLKYFVEAIAIYLLAGRLFTPIDFLNPWLAGREYFTADAPLWFGMAWVLWAVPFLWIGVTMSVRRSNDLRWSPWMGLLIAIPIVNLVFICLWTLLPSHNIDPSNIQDSPTSAHGRPATTVQDDGDSTTEENLSLSEIYSPLRYNPLDEPPEPDLDGTKASVCGIAVGVVYILVMVVISTSGFESYGAALFFGAPILTGAVAAYVRNQPAPVSLSTTLSHSAMTLVAACCAFIMFGIEGVICVAMAVPIVVPLGLLGALLGRAIALQQYHRRYLARRGLYSCLAILPLLVPIEHYFSPQPEFEVVSQIEISAPIDVVWKNVIHFPDINTRPEWFFRLGIAYPQRAKIKGTGVGAIRYCEFTTGAFVEPITVWNEPHRLAFDVRDQPEPMFELTPYRHLHPPHLDGAFRSVRGEFRLEQLSPDRTLLQGSTWYQLDIHPLSYWTIWTDWIVHRIHLRVLEHIRQNCESSQHG